MKSRSKYHHGELRSALVSLAVTEIARAGVEKLSLRSLARQAGVSPTAPFRHFPDKRSLLASIAIEGFGELASRLTETSESNPDIEERFIELGTTYVGFAQDFPVHYQLMFGAVLGDFSTSTELQEAAASSYAVLDAALAEMKHSQALDHDVATIGGLVWSTVHGMASLVINVPMASVPTGADAAPRQAVKSIHEHMRVSLKMVYRGVMR
ncbi:MAG: TetR/AcrR family transcriptional regulator [Pseudomonadota bacterium]|nr:TetR/AcrR family transcriptional regulator [Pseudomonadota bacterium]MEC8437388.1 TetR/AcrR family transcriptional regulator [Pseudomonadota bacterium]